MHRVTPRLILTTALGAIALLLIGSVWSYSANAQSYSVLVFYETAGFAHDSIDEGRAAIKQLGQANGFTVEETDNADAFTTANLANYRVLIFLSTTGDILNAGQQAALEQYIRAGGGWVGIHAASDAEYDWPWYGGLVGAWFKDHPSGTPPATINVTDRTHPSTAHLPATWSRSDEWYNFQSNPRPNVNVLMTLDENSYSGGNMGADHPIAWYHLYDGGRAWYTGLGHTAASFSEPNFTQHLLGGIRWAAERPAQPSTAPSAAPSPAPSAAPSAAPSPSASPGAPAPARRCWLPMTQH